MLTWPSRATTAIRKLFEPLQDIDVFIEDAGDEVFYSYLMRRVTSSGNKVIKVFSKSGRQSVIDAARDHQHDGRRAMYLIDGDFEWVLSQPAPNIPRLFRIPAYCIENLLISEAPAVRLVLEELVISEQEAGEAVDFNSWILDIEDPLVRLFSAFALSNEFLPTRPTVSLGVSRFYMTETSGSLPKLDVAKLNDEIDDIIKDIGNNIGNDVANNRYNEILNMAKNLEFPMDIVSGKDFLLPLLDVRLRFCSCRIRRKTLRFRLALNSDVDRFISIRLAIDSAL